MNTKGKELFDWSESLVDGSIKLDFKDISCFGSTITKLIILINCNTSVDSFLVTKVHIHRLDFFISFVDCEDLHSCV